jgi:hypothetical protein
VSFAPSLRNRVKRLEQSLAPSRTTLTGLLVEAEARRGAWARMTDSERAEREARYRAHCIASLTAADEPAGTLEAQLQTAARRAGLRYLGEQEC